jgi:PKD repeat protein
MLVAIIISTALYGISNITAAHAAGLTGSFTMNPQFMLVGGNDSFTGTASGGVTPYKFNWTFGDGPLVANGSFVTHVFIKGGSYAVTLNVTDSTPLVPMKVSISNIVTVQGTPLSIDGWLVNWNMTTHHGVEISNVAYNGVPTIVDAMITGVLVRYVPPPPGVTQCLFFDDLGQDDLNSSIAGFSLQFSTSLSNPWFQIRASYNPSTVGYNYTQFWRFYQSGEWEAKLAIGHLGCGWNHIYEPHYRFVLAPGNRNRNLASQYTPAGTWQNLLWEGNYTDNGFRDSASNSTEWRLGDGHSYYYMRPTVSPWAPEMPRLGSHIILLRNHPGELEPTTEYTIVDSLVNPTIFVDGELTYRQDLAFYFIPKLWDHWVGLGPAFNAPPSIVSLSFYPSGI